MLPVLSREVVEGKQRVAILDQALDSLVVFDAPGFDEGVERGECILLGLGHPDLLERTLGLRLLALGQLSTACPNSVLAPLRKTSVSGSENVPGWVSSK